MWNLTGFNISRSEIPTSKDRVFLTPSAIYYGQYRNYLYSLYPWKRYTYIQDVDTFTIYF